MPLLKSNWFGLSIIVVRRTEKSGRFRLLCFIILWIFGNELGTWVWEFCFSFRVARWFVDGDCCWSSLAELVSGTRCREEFVIRSRCTWIVSLGSRIHDRHLPVDPVGCFYVTSFRRLVVTSYRPPNRLPSRHQFCRDIDFVIVFWVTRYHWFLVALAIFICTFVHAHCIYTFSTSPLCYYFVQYPFHVNKCSKVNAISPCR